MAVNLKVVDLSHHNVGPDGGDIDFSAMKDFGIRGVILKATQGVTYHDPTFLDRREAARAAGLLVGAYDFNTGDPVKQQVEYFFDFVKPDDQMLCALDFEDNKKSNMSLQQAREYLEYADQKLGRNFWLYTGNRFKQLITDADEDMASFFGQHKLWLAQYGPQPKLVDVNGDRLPWDKATLWQFSGDGVNNQGISVPGVDDAQASTLDMNSYDGTDEQLAADWVS